MRNASLLLALLFVGGLARPAAAQQAEDFFKQRCAMCHTVGGGKLVGPDLKDVTQRRDRAWLERFIQNPKAVIDAGDPIALELQKQAGGMVMPTAAGMTPQMAKALVDFIAAESRRATSTPAARAGENNERKEREEEEVNRDDQPSPPRPVEAPGRAAPPPSGESASAPSAQPATLPATDAPTPPEPIASALDTGSVGDQPFTESDVLAGTRIFTGVQGLGNGGPACAFCHMLGTVSGIGGLGGGRLGPDLTLVYERLGGRRGVGAWLSSPPTPTMQAVFGNHPITPDEITPLLAVFEYASKTSHPAGAATHLRFIVLGLVGAGLALALMGWIWKGRIRSVRRSLVQAAQRGAR